MVKDLQGCIYRPPSSAKLISCFATGKGLFEVAEFTYDELSLIVQFGVTNPRATLFRDRYAPIIIAYPSLYVARLTPLNSIAYRVVPYDMWGHGFYHYELAYKRLYQGPIAGGYYKLVFSEVHHESMYEMPKWMQESKLRFSPKYAMDIETGQFVDISGFSPLGRSTYMPELNAVTNRARALHQPYSIIDPLVSSLKFSYRRIENDIVYDYYQTGNQMYRVPHSYVPKRYGRPVPLTSMQPGRGNNPGSTPQVKSDSTPARQAEPAGLRDLEIETKTMPDGSRLVITRENGTEVSRSVLGKPDGSNSGGNGRSGSDSRRDRRPRPHRDRSGGNNGNNSRGDTDSDISVEGGTTVIKFEPLIITPRQ